MKYVNASNVKYAIIVGEDEANNNYVMIKNMFEGTQEQVPFDQVSEYIKNNK